MANSSIPITAGSGTDVDTQTRADGNHAQVVVLGGPSTGECPVDSTAGIPVHAVPFASGGCSIHHAVSAGSTNALNVKASAGQIYGISISNRAAYPVYLKLHNDAGVPTPGAGVVYTVGVQAGADRHLSFPSGLAFATGIARSIVKLLPDNDATAVIANDCVVDIEFK